jgi:hypothetical protein
MIGMEVKDSALTKRVNGNPPHVLIDFIYSYQHVKDRLTYYIYFRYWGEIDLTCGVNNMSLVQIDWRITSTLDIEV